MIESVEMTAKDGEKLLMGKPEEEVVTEENHMPEGYQGEQPSSSSTGNPFLETQASGSGVRARVRRADEEGDPHMIIDEGNGSMVRARSEDDKGGGNPEREVRRRVMSSADRKRKAEVDAERDGLRPQPGTDTPPEDIPIGDDMEGEDELGETHEQGDAAMMINGITAGCWGHWVGKGHREEEWDNGVKQMEKTLRNYDDCLRDVSVDREVTSLGKSEEDILSLIPGLLLAFSGYADGVAWDFNDNQLAERAERLVKEKRGLLMITSPACAIESTAKTLEEAGVNGEEVLEYKRRHLDWCAHLCKLQRDQGLYFVHEHAAGASSWRNEEWGTLMNHDKVLRFHTGSVSLTARGNTPSLQKHRNGKRGYLTNAESAKELLERSVGKSLGAEADWTYKILGAIHEQMIRDGRRTSGDAGSTMGVDEDLEWTKQVEEQYWDDSSGKLLDAEGVRKARAVEMGHVKDFGVYQKVPTKQCWDKTGKKDQLR